MDETKPKKLNSRNLAIVLGVIGIILVASLTEALIVLNGANQRNTNLQNQNQQLQAWLYQNETLLNETQDNCTNLQNIANLNESEQVWSENNIIYFPSSHLVVGGYSDFPCAGYVLVNINATSETIVEGYYTFQNQNFTSQVDCGTSGTAIFPVMPRVLLNVIAPLNKPPAGWTANWTLTYYY